MPSPFKKPAAAVVHEVHVIGHTIKCSCGHTVVEPTKDLIHKLIDKHLKEAKNAVHTETSQEAPVVGKPLVGVTKGQDEKGVAQEPGNGPQEKEKPVVAAVPDAVKAAVAKAQASLKTSG